MLCSLG